MNPERAEIIYKVYYFNTKDPFGIHSRSFYKIRDRFVLKAFGRYFSGTGKTMLDLGSSAGTLMKKIAAAFPTLQITCSDINPTALAYLKENTSFTVLELKIPQLEGLQQTFNIVSCFDTYYLLNKEDMKTGLDRIAHILNGPGSLFLVDSDLSGMINPLIFRQKESVHYFTDKLSKVLYFSVEEKFRNKYYVLKKEYRDKLIEYNLLPKGYKPRLQNLWWVIFYLLYPLRMINKLLYSSVLANKLFSLLAKEKYKIFIYEKLK
ncbi:MAG: class I SAM-dependent methyltransferase [Bacteroidetes bacterium]|nr:class I SAM-dependent methyltransferase [Bacteroidota bacterium]